MNTPNLFSMWQKKGNSDVRIKIISVTDDGLQCVQTTGGFFLCSSLPRKNHDLYENWTEVYLPDSIHELSGTTLTKPTPWPLQHTENHDLCMPDLKKVRITD